jgi:peroxiredoxin Q/BCP
MKLGQKAPDFSLKDRTGKLYSLKSFKDKFLIVYFYPKDDTPGCTIETKNFSSDRAKFEKLGAQVVGISGGDEKSKEKFCKKHNIALTLLSDTDFAVAKSYDSFGEKTFMGRKFNGIFRNTFVLDASKKIVQIFEKVSPEEHSEEVLSALYELGGKVKPVTKATSAKTAKENIKKAPKEKATTPKKTSAKNSAAKKTVANKAPKKMPAAKIAKGRK